MKRNESTTTAIDDPRIAFFDGHAATWDTDGPDVRTTLRRLEEWRNLLDLRAGQDVLEVGCGTGQITGWLTDRVRPGRVIAVDFSQAMIAKARSKSIQAEFRCADVCRDDLAGEQFDVILCFHAFPHFRDKPTALANLARALKPGGQLVIMHLAGSAEINAFHDQVGGPIAGDHMPERSTWDTLLSHAGLQQTCFVDQPGFFFLRAVASTA
jgi:SAM-dependent methyltransferase